MTLFTESEVEAAALEWLDALGWRVARGPDASTSVARTSCCSSTVFRWA